MNNMGGKSISKRDSSSRKRTLSSGLENETVNALALTSKAWRERQSHQAPDELTKNRNRRLLPETSYGTQRRQTVGEKSSVIVSDDEVSTLGQRSPLGRLRANSTAPSMSSTTLSQKSRSRSVVLGDSQPACPERKSSRKFSAGLQNGSATSKEESEVVLDVGVRVKEDQRGLDLQRSGQDGAADFVPAMPGGLYGDGPFVSKAAFEAIVQPSELQKALSNEPTIGAPGGTLNQESSKTTSIKADSKQPDQTVTPKGSSERSSLGKSLIISINSDDCI